MNWQILFIGIAVLISVVASAVVARSIALSPWQRVLQHAFVWLVPYVGAIVCLVFASSQARDPLASSGTFDPLRNPNDGGQPASDGVPNVCGCSGASDAGGD